MSRCVDLDVAIEVDKPLRPVTVSFTPFAGIVDGLVQAVCIDLEGGEVGVGSG